MSWRWWRFKVRRYARRYPNIPKGASRQDTAAERALADQLAEVLRWVSDPELCEQSHETIIGIWQSTADALAAYEAARRGEP